MALLASATFTGHALIVGEQIRIQGAIEGAEDVVVRGRVEGALRIEGSVTVEEGAWVLAEVQAREVIVRGTLRGNVRAEQRIEVARTGRMVGDATAPWVTIAAGAGFRGRVEMGDASTADEAPPSFAPRGQAATVAAVAVEAAQGASVAGHEPPRQIARAAPQRRGMPTVVERRVTAPRPATSDRQGIPPLSRPTSSLKRRPE